MDLNLSFINCDYFQKTKKKNGNSELYNISDYLLVVFKSFVLFCFVRLSQFFKTFLVEEAHFCLNFPKGTQVF